MKLEKLFLSANGRIGRQDYWIGSIILIVVNLLVNLIPVEVIATVLGLVLIYPCVCVYSKRLHDLGLSGWWQAAVYAVSVIAVVVAIIIVRPGMMAVSGGPEDELAMLSVLGQSYGALSLLAFIALINIGFVIWLGAAPGQLGDNRFGRAPVKADIEEDAA